MHPRISRVHKTIWVACFWLVACSGSEQPSRPADDQELARTFSAMLANDGLAAACAFVKDLCDVLQGRACDIYAEHCQAQTVPNDPPRDGGLPAADLGAPSAVRVAGFSLINADSDLPIGKYDPIGAGATIDLGALPTRNLNIRANVTGGTPKSVTFTMSGPEQLTRVEAAPPYSLKGDVIGNYAAWTPSIGNYQLSARADNGAPFQIAFSVRANGSTGPADAGAPRADAKVPPADAKVPPADAKVPPADAKVPPADAKVPPADAKVPPPPSSLKKRIAISSDGNAHDPDDWGASALSLAILARAGLQSQLVHYDYSSHIWSDSVKGPAQMKESVVGGAGRFGFNPAVLFDARANLAAAVENIRQLVNASTAASPLYYVIGGPMEVAWLGLNAADDAHVKNVICISHSSWNDNHAKTDHGGHSFADLLALGCVSNHIAGQNAGFNTGDMSDWNWIKATSNGDWLWSRIDAVHNIGGGAVGDASDAGMVYYLLTGDQHGDPVKLKSWWGI